MKNQIKNVQSTMYKVQFVSFVFICIISIHSYISIGYAQNISINTTGAAANTDAILDLNTGNTFTSPNGKGLLIPQISLTNITDVTTIATPANGLIVYNTNAAMTNGNGVGLYFYCSSGCTTTGYGVDTNMILN